MLYINQRFVILVFLAGLAMIVLAQVIFRERPASRSGENSEAPENNNPDHQVQPAVGWNLWWLALPVLIGLLIPARPLGASVLANRGINTSAPLTARLADAQFSLSLAPSERTVLDWIRLFNAGDERESYLGQPVDVIGFVYHDPRLGPGQFMVGRFTITCCVADALALGMIVDWPGVEGLVENTWVRVQGSLDMTTLDGNELPLIRADTVEAVAQPEQPYLFP